MEKTQGMLRNKAEPFLEGDCCKLLYYRNKTESADKPGSVVNNHSSRLYVAIKLKQATRVQCEQHLMNSYLPLLQAGFALPLMLPSARCALTAPFHPYPASLYFA